MKVNEVYEIVNAFAPFDIAMKDDNAGFLFGDRQAEVTGIMTSLEADMDALRQAVKVGCNVIVSHHPMFFDGEKSMTTDSPYGIKLLFAAENGLHVISAHTNLDACPGGINDTLGALLSLTATGSFFTTQNGGTLGRIGTHNFSDIYEFLRHAADVLGTTPRYCIATPEFQKVAWVSGSGFSFFRDAVQTGIDTFITGDCKYSYFIEAAETGVNLIDLGHFETEQIIVPVLTKLFESVTVPVISYIHPNIIKTL